MVKRLRHGPFTAVTWVRFPYGSYKKVLQLRLKGFFYASRTESNRAADCRKVPSSRHVRMDGTHTGKFAAESVRGRQAECMVQRQILSPGTAQLRRILRMKQPKRSRGSGLPFSSAIFGVQKMQGTATIRGKEFLSRDCAQKWVPPKACRQTRFYSFSS